MAPGTDPILLVDDNNDTLVSLSRALKANGITNHIHQALNANQALELLKKFRPAVAIIDLVLDETIGPDSGFRLLQDILKVDSTIRVIFLTGHGSIETGIKALQLGAANFLEKPPDIQHLIALIKDGLVQCQLNRHYLHSINAENTVLAQELIGNSAAILEVRDQILHASKTMQPVLLEGETGSGKTFCARLIHRISPRANKNFVRYQPSFGSSDLVQSELFGHRRGSFTGAQNDRRGLISESNGGTLFLDEIDELPCDVQVSLLGCLQDKRYRQVGSDQETEVDFRLISATNQPIESSLKNRKIRSDLYHRIAHAKIKLPSLRERLSDLPQLIKANLQSLSEHQSISVFDIEDEAIKKLTAYSWPGNLRELSAIIEGAAYTAQFSGRSFITVQDIKLPGTDSKQETNCDFYSQVENFKRSLVEQALDQNGGNQSKTARALGLDRASLRRILNLKK